MAIVIIDAPPVMPASDAVMLSGVAHDTLIVVDMAQATTAQVCSTFQSLSRVGAIILGMVVKHVPTQALKDNIYEHYDDASYR